MSAPLWENSRVGGRSLARGPTSDAAFAGRDTELARLGAALAAVDATGAQTVLIGGEAGIGKTRLIEEFALHARAAGALVATGVCSPAEGGGLPYGPVIGILRDLTRQLDDRTVASVLAPTRQRFAALDAPSAGVPELTTTSELGKTHLFEALLECFRCLAERSRVVVVFEDLHWADSASVDVIDFLARNLGASPLLVVGSYRREELGPDQAQTRVLTELGRHRGVSDIELGGLDRNATAVLMAGILGERPDRALLDAVYARSEGNPFFAEELTAARDAASLPDILRNVIMLRVDRLGPAARHVAAVVATAGGSIDHRLLGASSSLEAAALDAAITEAVDLLVLRVDDRSTFRFRHALQSDAVDAALLPNERARLHRNLAVALTDHPELGASGPGHAAVELAGHWWGAQEWADALHTSLRAGDAMTRVLALPEACAQYERAVSACDRLPAAAGREAVDYGDLLVKASGAAYLTGRPQRSVELVERALAELDAATEPRRAAIALTVLGRSLWAVGDADRAVGSFRQARELLPAEPPSVELAAVLAEEARSFLLTAHDREAEVRGREAVMVARAVGARAEESHALTTLGAAIAERGEVDAAIDMIRDAVEIAEELGRPDVLDLSYKLLTHVLMQASRLDEAAQVVFDGMARDEALLGIRLNGAGGNSAEALIRRGRYDEAEDLMRRMDGHGVSSCLFGPFAVRALLSLRRGRFDDARLELDGGEEVSKGLRTVQVQGWLHILRAELALELDEPARAFAEIEQALSIAAGTDDHVYQPEMCAVGIRALADELASARVRGRRVDTDKFRRLAVALVELAETHVLGDTPEPVRRPPRPTAFLATCRAEESRLRGPDPDAWQRAAARWDEAAEPYFSAYCRWREAEATLAGRGGRARATEAVLDAWRTAVAIGSPPMQARVERLAQRARIAVSASPSGTVASLQESVGQDLGLTARETTVLAQLVLGRTDRQIADALYISKKTVSVHVSNLLRKLDAGNRIEAAEIGQRAGLT